MKKMMLMAAVAIVLLTGQSAIAGDALNAVAGAVGQGVAEAMGDTDGVINVTTATKDSEIKGENVKVGVVEAEGDADNRAIVNVTTVGGEVDANEDAEVGVVRLK